MKLWFAAGLALFLFVLMPRAEAQVAERVMPIFLDIESAQGLGTAPNGLAQSLSAAIAQTPGMSLVDAAEKSAVTITIIVWKPPVDVDVLNFALIYSENVRGVDRLAHFQSGSQEHNLDGVEETAVANLVRLRADLIAFQAAQPAQ